MGCYRSTIVMYKVYLLTSSVFSLLCYRLIDMTDMLIDNLIEYGVFCRSVVLIIDDDLSTFCLLTGYVFVFERCAFNLFATLHGLLWVVVRVVFCFLSDGLYFDVC